MSDRIDRVHEFRHLLEGKACLWYDEINLPARWDELMRMFCARFCIYGKESEDWYRHWSALHFDPASDTDIDDIITQVKTLARLLNFPDEVVLATLKNMFPQHRLHFFNVHDLPTLYHMLRAMFPHNRNQAIPGAASGASPFSAHQDQEPLATPATSQWPFDGVTFPRKPKLAEISRIQEDQMDRLEDTIERLAVMTDRKEKNGMYRNHDRLRGSKRPPFKPTITRCRQGRFSSSAPPSRKRERFFHREPSRGFTHNNSRGRYPSYGRPYNCYIKFDRSPCKPGNLE